MPLPKCNVDLPASSSVSRIFKLYLSLILSPSRLRVQNLLSDEKTMIKISSSCDIINKMMMVNFLKPVVRAGGGVLPMMAVRGGFAQRGYLFQVPGI